MIIGEPSGRSRALGPAFGNRELDYIEQILTSRCGFRFDEVQRRSLERALERRLAECRLSYSSDYVRLLSQCQGTSGEMGALLSEFTNTETHFFRHIGRFNLLRNMVLPSLLQSKSLSSDPIRVLSAGCSTGEEVYSVLITLHEESASLLNRRFEVTGCDINQHALTHAREARYNGWSLRFTPEEQIKHHFLRDQNLYRVVPLLREKAEFRYANLMDDNLEEQLGKTAYDIIFCCNVTIYFTKVAYAKLIEKLHSLLAPSGFLYLGYAEDLWVMGERFEPIRSDDYTVYRKQDVPPKSKTPSAINQPSKSYRPENSLERPQFNPTRYSSESRAQLPLPTSTKQPKVRPTPAIRGNGTPASSRHLAPPPATDSENMYLTAFEACRTDQQVESLKILNAILNADPHHKKARLLKGYLLSCQHQFIEAAAECTKIVDLDPLFAQSYLLMGIILQQMGDKQSAIAEIKKALFLTPELPLATYTLGALHEALDQKPAAIREYSQTIRLLDSDPNMTMAPDIPSEISPGFLRSVCEERVSRLALHH